MVNTSTQPATGDLLDDTSSWVQGPGLRLVDMLLREEELGCSWMFLYDHRWSTSLGFGHSHAVYRPRDLRGVLRGAFPATAGRRLEDVFGRSHPQGFRPWNLFAEGEPPPRLSSSLRPPNSRPSAPGWANLAWGGTPVVGGLNPTRETCVCTRDVAAEQELADFAASYGSP